MGEGMKRAIGRENMVNSGTEVGRYRTQRAVMGSSEALQPGSPEGQWWEEGQPELRRLICSLSSEFFGNNLHAQYKGGGSEWEKQTKPWQRNRVLLRTVSKTKYLL